MERKVTNDIFYIGVNDHQVDLFEGQYVVPNGMAYNSYIIKDELIAVMDTVDVKFTKEWLGNIKKVLGEAKPNYLIVQHMEPDHSANIMEFLKVYPDTFVVGNVKTFNMMNNFFHQEIKNKLVVSDNDTLNLGKHNLHFVFAPMVHWPEVMVTYDEFDKVLFSADGFGKFGALDIEEEWACEARRYYFGIVGKYGAQVQILLKKAASLDIQIICPLHGPILDKDLGYYLNLYNIWSSYESEVDGVAIFYTSVYGHTKEAAELLYEKVKENGAPKATICDLAREDMAECVEDAFKYNKIVLATTTYNSGIFPFMEEFLNHLIERNYQKKEVAIIENGSWAPMAAKVIKEKLALMKNINLIEPVVRINSSLDETSRNQIEQVADKLTKSYQALRPSEEMVNPKALFNIGYGLYVVTSRDNGFDNACIVNAISQVTDKPLRVAVTINKLNLTHDMVKKTGMCNVSCLSVDAPFKVFEDYGFVSGRDKDKFEKVEITRSQNGLAIITSHSNAYFSLKVEHEVDLGSHTMFICSVTESKVLSDRETMTYTYYQKNVKPKPQATKKKAWVCTVCGYIYEGDTLPEDFICPLCKHGVADFEPLND